MSIRDTLKNNLIAYWDFDDRGEGLTPDLYDSSTNGRTLEWAGTDTNITFPPGKRGDAAEWTGSNARYLHNEAGQWDFAGKSFLVSLWAYFDGPNDDASGNWIKWGADEASLNQVRIQTISGNVRFLLYRGTNQTFSVPISELTQGWHHFLFSYRGSDDAYRFFVDGVSEHSGTINGPLDRGGDWLVLSDNSSWARHPLDEIFVCEAFATQAISDWIYNNGDGRFYEEIAFSTFNGVAKFGSLPAKRVYAMRSLDWQGGGSPKVFDSTVPAPEGDYELFIPQGRSILLQSHAFEPESWRGIWKAETAVDIGDVMFSAPASNAHVLVCTQAGTTASSAPEWPSSGTVEDGSAEWEVIGTVQQLAPITNYYEVGSG